MSSANYRGRGFAPRGFRPRGPPGPRFPPPNFASNRGRNVDSSHGWADNRTQPWQQANRPQENHFEQKPWRAGSPNLWRGHDNQNRGGRNRRVNGRSRGNMSTSFVPQNGPGRGFGSERGPRRGSRGGPRLGYTVRRVAGCKFGFNPPRQPGPPVSDSLAVPALGSEEERQQKIAETAYNLKQKLSTSTVHDLNLYWEQNFQDVNNSLVEQPGSSNHAIPEQQPRPSNLGLTSNNLQDAEQADPVPEFARVINQGESCSSEEDERAAAATNTVEPIFESSDFNESTSRRDPVGNNSSRSTTPKTLEETELYLAPAFDPRGLPRIHNIIEHRPEQSHPTSAYYPHHMSSLNTVPPNHASFIPTLPFNSSGSAMPYQKQNELQPLPMAFNSQYPTTGCHSSNLVPVSTLDNRMISSGAINSRLIESSPNADLSNSMQSTGYAPSLATTYNSSIRLPTAVPCIVRDLAPLPLMVASTPSMLEPLPMPTGIFNIPVISSTTNHDSSVPLQKASSPNMDDELDDMQEALKFAKTQLDMKCEQSNSSNVSTFMPFDLVFPASSQQLLPPPPTDKLIITAAPALSSNENASAKLDSQPAMVELQKIKTENTTSVPSNQKVLLPNSSGDKVATNPIEVRSTVDNPPQAKSSLDAVTQNLLSTFLSVRQVDKINSSAIIDGPAILADIRKQPESVESDVIVNGCKKTYRAKINQERPKRQPLEQAVVKKSQNLVTRSPNMKHVLHPEARSMPAAGSSRKAKSSTPSDVNWKEKVISRFLKMSKNDIYNMVNSSGLRKFDVAMQHLVKEKKNSLSRERRNSADDMVKGCDMLREEFMSELGAMLDPSAVVDLENLPATFLQHLSEVLKLNDEPPLADDMENALKSRLTDDENARQGNTRPQEDIHEIDNSTNQNTSADCYTSLRPENVPNVNTTVTRRSEAVVELPKRTKAAKCVETVCQKNVGETSLDVVKMHRAFPGESSTKDSDRIVNRRKRVDPDPHTTVEDCTLHPDSELFANPKSAELAMRIEKRNASSSGLTVTNSLSKSPRPVTEESIYARLKKVERWNRQHCLSIDSYRNLTKEEWEEKYGKTMKNFTDKESISTHTRSISSSRDTSHERFSPSPKSTIVSESSGSKKLDHIDKVCYVDKAAETDPMQISNNVDRQYDVCTDLQNPASESTSSDESNSSRKRRSRQKRKRKRKDCRKKKRETSKRREKHVTKDGEPSTNEKLLAPDEIKKEFPVEIENIKQELPCPETLKKIESSINVDRSKTTMTMVVDRSKKLASVGQPNKNETLPALKKAIQGVGKSHSLEIASRSAANTELSETQAIACEPTQIVETNISSKEDTTVETNYSQSVAPEHEEILPQSMEDKQSSKLLKLAPTISENEVKKLPSAIESTLTEDKDPNKPETMILSNDDTKDSNDTPTFIVEHGAEMSTDKAIDLPSEQPRENLAAESKLADSFVVRDSLETQPAQLTKSGSKKIGIETYKARVLQRVTGKISRTSKPESRVQASMENLKNTPHDYKEISHTNEAAVDHVKSKRAAHTEQNAVAVQKSDVEARVHVKKSKTVTDTNEAKVAGHDKQPMTTVHENEPETAVQEEQPKTVVRAKQPKTSAHTNEAETVVHANEPKVAAHAHETKSTVRSNQPKMTVHAHHRNPHGSKSDPKKLQVGDSSTTHHTQKHSSSSKLKHGAKNKCGVKCATKDTLLKSETHGVAPLKPAKISKTVEVGDQRERNDSNKLRIGEEKESVERKMKNELVCMSENQKLSDPKKKHSPQENAADPEHGISTGSPTHRTVAAFTEHGKLSSKSSTQDNYNLACNSKKHSKRKVLDKKIRKKHSSRERSSKEKLSTEQASTVDASVRRSSSRPGPLSFKKSSISKKQESPRLSKIQSIIKKYLKSKDIKTKKGINLNPVVRLVRIVLPCKESKSLVVFESEKTVANVDNTLLEIVPSKDFDGIQAAERSDDQETERLKNDSVTEVIVNSAKEDEPISGHIPEAEEPPTTTIESETLSVPIDVGEENTVDQTTAKTVNCAQRLDEVIVDSAKEDEPISGHIPEAEEPSTTTIESETLSVPIDVGEENTVDQTKAEIVHCAQKLDEVIVSSAKEDETISAHIPEAEEPPTTTIESETLSVPIDVGEQNTVDQTTAETVNCAQKLDEVIVHSAKEDEPISAHIPEAEEPPTTTIESETLSVPIDVGEQNTVDQTTAETVNCAQRLDEVIVNSAKEDEPISAHIPEAEEPPTTTIESEPLSVPIDVGEHNAVDETTAETVNCAQKLDKMSGIENNYDSRLPDLRSISPPSSCNQQEDIENLIELPADVELGQEYYDSKDPSAMQYSEMDVAHEETSDENLANFDAVDMTSLPTEVITDIQLSELEDNESIDIDIVEATGESTEFLLDSEMQRNSDEQCESEIDKFNLSLQSSNELGYASYCQAEPWITNILNDLIDEVSNRWNASTSTEHVPIEVNSEPIASNSTEISSVDTGERSLTNQRLSPEITDNTDRNDIESSVTTFELQIDAHRSDKTTREESANVDYAVSDKFSNNDSVVADELVGNDEDTHGKLVDANNTAGSESPVNSISPLKCFSDEYIQSSSLSNRLLIQSIVESFDSSLDDTSEKNYQHFEKNELSSETKNDYLESMTTSGIVNVITENSLTKDTEEISTDIRFGSNEAIDKSDSTNEVDIPYRETLCNEPPEKQSDNTEECQSLEAIQPDVQEEFDWLQFTTESKTLDRVEKDTNDGKINNVAENECNESDLDTVESLDFENGEFIVVSEVASDEEGSIDKGSFSRQDARADKSATRKSLANRITNRVIQSIKYSSTSDANDSTDETSLPKTPPLDPIHSNSGDSNGHDTTDATDLQAEQISKLVSTTETCTASIDLETSTSFDVAVNDVVPREEVPVTNDNSTTAIGNSCIFDIWMDKFDARDATEVNMATESREENTLNIVDNTANEKTTSSSDHEEMKKLPCENIPTANEETTSGNDHEEMKKLPSENMPTEPADGVSEEMREEARVQLADETSIVAEVNKPCNNNTSDTQNQSIIDELANNDIDSNDTEQQTGTEDDVEGHNSRMNRSLKGKTLYVKWDKSSVAANLNRSKSAHKSRFSSSKDKSRDRLYKSERKIKHKKRNKLRLAAGKVVAEAMKSQEVVTTVKSQDVVKSIRKPTTKESVMARMIEIDVEIHTLMSEKMKLYEMLESGSFSDAQGPPVIDDADLSGNIQPQTTPRCKTPVAIMTEIMNHLESDHTTTEHAGSTIVSNEESAGESTKQSSSSSRLKKLRSLRRKIKKRDKNRKSSSKIEARKLKRMESQKLAVPVNDKQHGSAEMIAKPILKKTNTVEKPAEERSRSTVNWESGIEDSVNDRCVEHVPGQNDVPSKKSAGEARDKKISRIRASNEKKKRKYPFSDNRKRSREQKRSRLKPALECTLTNEEEEMPLAKLYDEIIQRQTNSVGGGGNHLTEVINAVAENKMNEYETSSLELRKESDVGKMSGNISRPDPSSSNEPAATPSEKVDESKKCENHDQIKHRAESRRSVADGNSPVATDDSADLQTFDDIGGDVTFGNRTMTGSIVNATSQNNNYDVSQTADPVAERKSQDKPNDDNPRMSESENRESSKSEVLSESAMDNRAVKQQSFAHFPPISDSVAHSNRGSINLEIIEAGINAFDTILGKVDDNDKSAKNIPTASFTDKAVSIEDTGSKEDTASADREVMKAFDQIDNSTIVNSESSIRSKYFPNVEDLRQRKIEDADRSTERSHLRRNSAKNAREAITQQSAPVRAVKSKERTAVSPGIRMLNRPNESNESEDSRRRGKKRKMSRFEMANCKVWLIDCKYTYLKTRSLRKSSERFQVSRNDHEVDRNADKPFEAIESNIDSNVEITKGNSDIRRKTTNSAIPRGESILPLANENVNISETTSKPKIHDDTAKRSIETGNAASDDDSESSYPAMLKSCNVDDSNDSQMNPNPRALRSMNKSKKVRIQAARSTPSTTKLPDVDQSKEITNCEPTIASENLDGRMTKTTVNTVDIPKVPTSNTEVEIVEELATPRNDEIEKSNNDSTRCSGSADVIEVETPRIQYTAHKGPILDIKVFHDSFLAASEDGMIYRYSQNSDEVLNTYQGHKSAVTCMCIVKIATGVPKTELLFSGSLDASLRCFDIKSGQEVQNMSYVGSAVQCMDHAWGMIFLGTKTGFVSRFNVKNNSFKGEPIPFSKESVLALKATTEGPRRVLIAASRHQPITIRDAYDGLLVRTVSGHRTHTVYSLMMHNNLVYCGTSSTAIPVFDFINGSQVTLYNAGMGIVCIQMYQELLFAGCYDGNIYVFDTKEQKIVCSIPGPGNMLLSMGIVQNKLIAGSKDRRLHIWQIPKQVQTLLRRKT